MLVTIIVVESPVSGAESRIVRDYVPGPKKGRSGFDEPEPRRADCQRDRFVCAIHWKIALAGESLGAISASGALGRNCAHWLNSFSDRGICRGGPVIARAGLF